MTVGAYEPIVTFADPPVAEVVVSVAFAADTGAETLEALIGAFWTSRLRPRFPKLQKQPPYNMPIERFEEGVPAQGSTVRFGLGPMPTRLWALSSDDQELLQMQPDWFACNWRKVRPDNEYDQWRSRRDSFRTWFEEFSTFLRAEGVANLVPHQCEVTYINHITSGKHWTRHADIGRILKPAAGCASVLANDLDQLAAQASFVVRSPSDATPIGRLHVSVTPAFDGVSPTYALELTCRGNPLSPDSDGVMSFLDLGRESIDRAFVALTTDEIREEWGEVR